MLIHLLTEVHFYPWNKGIMCFWQILGLVGADLTDVFGFWVEMVVGFYFCWWTNTSMWQADSCDLLWLFMLLCIWLWFPYSLSLFLNYCSVDGLNWIRWIIYKNYQFKWFRWTNHLDTVKFLLQSTTFLQQVYLEGNMALIRIDTSS